MIKNKRLFGIKGAKSIETNQDWDLTLSEKCSQNFMGQKANYTTLVLFYLTTCPLKQEGTQIRTEETLITKVGKKKKNTGKFLYSPNTNNY